MKERDEAYALVDVLQPLTVPSTLHDSLAARLDRLGEGKRLAQLAAVIGREFSYALIRAVADVDEATLQQELSQLADAEILYRRGLLPNATFLFKHALIQEAAYQSLLRPARRQHHRQIARVLEGQFPDIRESRPELLAHHYTEAGLHRNAVDYWQHAASQAWERAAFLEAEAHVQQGLLAAARLRDASERHQYELTLQTRLAAVVRFTKSYGAPEVIQALRQAQELCEQVGDVPQLFSVMRSLWLSYIAQKSVNARLRTRRAPHRAGAATPGASGSSWKLTAIWGRAGFFLGEFTVASQHFDQSRRHGPHTVLTQPYPATWPRH